MAGIDLMPNARTLLILFFQATLKRGKWPTNEWVSGPLNFEGADARASLLPAVQHAVVGQPDLLIRWHLDLESAPLSIESGRIIAVEALKLVGLIQSYVIIVHTVIDPSSGLLQGHARPWDMRAALKTVIGLDMELSEAWGGSHVQHPAAFPTPISELIIAPDNPAALPEPSVRLTGPDTDWNEYQYRSYWLTRDEAEPSSDMISAGINQTLPVGGGTLLVGGYRSVAENDSNYEHCLRSFVLDAVLFGVAQNVMLNCLTRLALGLANPWRDPSAATYLSRGIVAYRSLYAWTGGSVLGPDRQVIENYRRRASLQSLEESLTSFESATQSALSAQTNGLLGLIATLGLAATLAVAVREAAGWNGWSSLWAILVAITITVLLLFFPLGKTLRAAIFRR